jgi:hypothetical protein
LAGKCVKEKLKLKAQGHIPDCRTSSNSKTTKPNTKRAAHGTTSTTNKMNKIPLSTTKK